jgi:hypothetical protein
MSSAARSSGVFLCVRVYIVMIVVVVVVVVVAILVGKYISVLSLHLDHIFCCCFLSDSI